MLEPTVFEVFDDDFDLILQVGTSPTAQFKVDSRCMKRACKAWKTMLYGEFSERKPKTGQWIVFFPEDAIDPFRTVLHLIHGNTIRVDKKPNLDYMYTLLDFIGKWDLFQLFEPWRELWIKWLSRTESPLKDISVLGSRQGFFIAWTLGYHGMVASIYHELVRHSYCNQKGVIQLRFSESDDFYLDHHLDSNLFCGESL